MTGLKILCLSDVEIPAIYSPNIRERFRDFDLVISCGDLPFNYLEYVISMLDIPLYFVQGNHVTSIDFGNGNVREEPWGGINLNRCVIYDRSHDLILAGIEGSLRYNEGDHQYTEAQMWRMVLAMVPQLLWNKIRHGRYLDIFVTHSPSAGIQDQTDLPHRGVQAFKWLVSTFKPALHLHGHIHLYDPRLPRETQFGPTTVVNAYGYHEIHFPGVSTSPGQLKTKAR